MLNSRIRLQAQEEGNMLAELKEFVICRAQKQPFDSTAIENILKFMFEKEERAKVHQVEAKSLYVLLKKMNFLCPLSLSSNLFLQTVQEVNEHKTKNRFNNSGTEPVTLIIQLGKLIAQGLDIKSLF